MFPTYASCDGVPKIGSMDTVGADVVHKVSPGCFSENDASPEPVDTCVCVCVCVCVYLLVKQVIATAEGNLGLIH